MATETERFAELMRGFKERSGRSYGTLAKRLHSSNSTLHRYCSGATVPTDYAPVERFARVCGASADELLALHRQWLLALVERRRGATEVPPASAAVVVAGEASEVRPQAETDPEPAPASSAGSAPAPGPGGAGAPPPPPPPRRPPPPAPPPPPPETNID
ncbi:helix-turn-helix domain-containing protein, partial [Streptomyces lavendulae]|uniref:helix-turn-helix domain-containing protein n=1 Tax=Streptomyces lavendulae TaxID=1914 RepID=UPI00368583F8